jgi:NADPH:quinone reductase-like Zn-dependent oxidoreductase
MAPGGRIRTVATTPIDPEGLPAVPQFFAVTPDSAQLERIAAAVAASRIAVPIDQELPIEAAAAAHRLVEAGGLRGKVILKP